MGETYIFVQTSHNWADEFDMEGASVWTKSVLEDKLANIKKGFEEGRIREDHEFYFGTNEALQFYDYNDFERGVKMVECSEEFHDEFKRIVRGRGVGIDIINRLNDRANEPAEDEDD